VAKARRGRKQRPRRTPTGGGGGGREHWRADGQPKTRYGSADDANRYALHALLEDGAQLDPYVCGICGDWHLGNRRD
jgi:hypothetical protein